MFERQRDGMAYLAIPYNGKYEHGTCPRIQHVTSFQMANLVTALLIEDGEVVYSPVTHSHPLVGHMRRTHDHKFWMDYDLCMMELCNRLYVIAVDGWNQSKGVFQEIDWFLKKNLPVHMLHPHIQERQIDFVRYDDVLKGMDPFMDEYFRTEEDPLYKRTRVVKKLAVHQLSMFSMIK